MIDSSEKFAKKFLIGFFALFCVLTLLFVGLIIYTLREPANPNYLEDGWLVALYRTEDCARAADAWNKKCILTQKVSSRYTNITITLYKALESTANQKEWGLFGSRRLSILNGYSKSWTEWSCYAFSSERLILDNSKEVIQRPDFLYNCWPKINP